MEGSYLIPRSMCSWIPKPKLPVLEKLSFLNSYSLTLRPRSRISSALAPRTVQWTAIFSLRRIPKERTVYLAFEKTGCWPVSCSKTYKTRNVTCYYISTFKLIKCAAEEWIRTLAALVSLSPDSPTQMFRHNLRIRRSRIMFLDLSLLTTS